MYLISCTFKDTPKMVLYIYNHHHTLLSMKEATFTLHITPSLSLSLSTPSLSNVLVYTDVYGSPCSLADVHKVIYVLVYTDVYGSPCSLADVHKFIYVLVYTDVYGGPC